MRCEHKKIYKNEFRPPIGHSCLRLLLTRVVVLATLFVEVVLFALNIHHPPGHQEEHNAVNQQTKSRRAAIRAGERLTQETTRQDVRLRVRNNKERQRGNHGDGELLLLLLTVTAAAAILKQSHAFCNSIR